MGLRQRVGGSTRVPDIVCSVFMGNKKDQESKNPGTRAAILCSVYVCWSQVKSSKRQVETGEYLIFAARISEKTRIGFNPIGWVLNGRLSKKNTKQLYWGKRMNRLLTKNHQNLNQTLGRYDCHLFNALAIEFLFRPAKKKIYFAIFYLEAKSF